MSSRFATLFATALVLAITASGCGQTRGETCQVHGDCESGLICCKTTGSVPARGTCQPDSECTDITETDAGMEEDAGEGEVDAGEGETDAGEGETDAGDGETDAGSDAGGDDAGTDASTEDAGTDAAT
ncbi:hypothetical protein [Sandaracinus amylolyticus]|uniref:Fibronectin type III domain protein n=1 Tax=Sandaracinus amylolyticus TaxID=927083 RepID=A0A0F6W7U2_9BACT|nr:hypothetical protein [Sandaracinus amylolyticus]AKF09630.1 fibronectin type III domain protein [Sandaracinus amylolyticus]